MLTVCHSWAGFCHSFPFDRHSSSPSSRMTAPRMRRDMSYRKPVPHYEPTPPPSPLPSLAGLSSPPLANELPSVRLPCRVPAYLEPTQTAFQRPWKDHDGDGPRTWVPSMLLGVEAPAPTAYTIGRRLAHTVDKADALPPLPISVQPSRAGHPSPSHSTKSSSSGESKSRQRASKPPKPLALAEMVSFKLREYYNLS